MSVDLVRPRRRLAMPLLCSTIAAAVGGVADTVAMATTPNPDLIECTVDPIHNYDFNPDDLYPQFYVQWDPSNYSDPTNVVMFYYCGYNTTTVGMYPDYAFLVDDGSEHPLYTHAAETSQQFWPFNSQTGDSMDPYDSSIEYIIGVLAYDVYTDEYSEEISWMGATETT